MILYDSTWTRTHSPLPLLKSLVFVFLFFGGITSKRKRLFDIQTKNAKSLYMWHIATLSSSYWEYFHAVSVRHTSLSSALVGICATGSFFFLLKKMLVALLVEWCFFLSCFYKTFSCYHFTLFHTESTASIHSLSVWKSVEAFFSSFLVSFTLTVPSVYSKLRAGKLYLLKMKRILLKLCIRMASGMYTWPAAWCCCIMSTKANVIQIVMLKRIDIET